jgi:hypothetical protein
MKSTETTPLLRRQFIRLVPALSLGTLLLQNAHSEDAVLKDDDAEARAINYRTNANQVDRAKFPKYAPGQNCNNCLLFIGEPGKPTGGCGVVFGKQVAATGWCSSWEVKA